MKLRVRFLQLPVLFDAARLAEEVGRIAPSAWRPHPKKFAGNDALPLITTDGDPSSDARAGKMAPTDHLLACPYLMQVLESLGATWGRSRLMRLSGDSEVTPHVDTDYYWRDHMRVHVPIVTQPTVRFHCGGETVHMAAGECWVFDTWSLHSVKNDATRARIHLVADTVGGDGLLDLIEKGRAPADARADWSPSVFAPRATPPGLAYESRNSPEVMTPWELKDHLSFLLSEANPGDPRVGPISQTLNRLRVNWHALWAEAGDDPAARPRYAQHLAQARDRLERLDVDTVALRNQMSLGLCLRALILDAALGDASKGMDQDQRIAPTPMQAKAPPVALSSTPSPIRPAAARPAGHDPLYDRPIFIVSSPRSGSSLLFETLAAAKDLYTTGKESHGLMEAIPALSPSARGWASNRLEAADAEPEVAQDLRKSFWLALKDRAGAAPGAGPIRMLEKTPKNALRIPFLATVFPEARFIYLYRAPGPTMSSMMEAWRSGRFRTYPQLPGWSGPDWSLLLTPGWREFVDAPLERIVAHQWSTTTTTMLADLRKLPADRWRALDYDAFIADPQAEILSLCEAMQLGWDKSLGRSLPFSRHTVSEPKADKWRTQAELIERCEAIWRPADDLALSLLAKTLDPVRGSV